MKIIQILVTPDNSTYQGKMLGLGDDGVTYYAENRGWKTYFGAHIADAEPNTVTISREVYDWLHELAMTSPRNIPDFVTAEFKRMEDTK
jgi:hypothetical protein